MSNFQHRPFGNRLATPLDIFVVSGERVTRNQIAERLGVSNALARERQRRAIAKMAPGQVLTWEAMSGGKS